MWSARVQSVTVFLGVQVFLSFAWHSKPLEMQPLLWLRPRLAQPRQTTVLPFLALSHMLSTHAVPGAGLLFHALLPVNSCTPAKPSIAQGTVWSGLAEPGLQRVYQPHCVSSPPSHHTGAPAGPRWHLVPLRTLCAHLCALQTLRVP